jgi:hypothetical protein
MGILEVVIALNHNNPQEHHLWQLPDRYKILLPIATLLH